VFLVGQLRPGGSEHQLFCLLQAMDRERYQPAVVVWNHNKDDTYVSRIQALGVPLHGFPSTLPAAAKLRAFRGLVKRLTPEVVHSFSFYTNFAAWWGTLSTKTIAIGALRGDFQRAKKDSGLWLGRLSGRWPRTQISNNFVAAASVKRLRSPFVPRQLFVVRNGLDLQRFRVGPFRAAGQNRIVGVGSLLPVKRWDRLVVAAAELKRRGFDFSVRIVGDGPLRESLKRQAEGLGVGNCVEFLGYRDNIPGFLADAMFLVHTSDSEGCPNVVMEAMACGRAVVATDVGDVPDLVEDGKTGFVVHRGDDAMLVGRIVTLITTHDLCHQMGKAGRAKAEREFGLDRVLLETLATYRSMGWRDASRDASDRRLAEPRCLAEDTGAQ